MSSQYYCFVLSKSQTDHLLEILSRYEDRGPRDESWQSDELIELGNAIKKDKEEQDMTFNSADAG